MWIGNRAQRALKGFGAALAVVLLGSCGGSTEQIEPFDPTRLLVFGDEMSVLTKELPQGRKYSVNALNSDGSLDCGSLRIWVQVLGGTFGFAFEECNPNNQAQPRGRIFAEAGAKVDDLPGQFARAAATGCFNETDLVSVLIGANDVIDVYENQYVPDPNVSFQNNPTYQAALAEIQRRGTRLGQRIFALTTLGPKVIVSTIPMMNLTPYAIQQAALRPEASARSVLQNFSNTFNTAMRVTIPDNGLFVGLVELDALVQAGVNNPDQYGLRNVTQAACTMPLPDCTPNTLVSSITGNGSTWLWASDKWIGSTAHLNLGDFARNRARGNPFGSPNGTQCRN